MKNEQTEINTFAQMASTNSGDKKAPQVSKEISISDFSDTAIGEKKKYIRPDLNGKEDVIEMFQVFSPSSSDEPKISQSGTSKYWTVTMILTYQSENNDGVKNREYISGAKSFENKDGSPSATNFWYKNSETQSAMLWEMVAEKIGVEPEQMSPRQFVSFLNSKPKVKISGMKYKNYGASATDDKFITKNMPGAFI